MFPEVEITETTAESTQTMGTTFAYDFTAGDFPLKDGKLQKSTQTDAVKVWIQKVLRTEKDKYSIYSTEETPSYGAKLLDLVNSRYPQAFIEEEIKREITEALSRNTDITNVTNFIFSREKRGLSCSFTVDTIYNTSIVEGVII